MEVQAKYKHARTSAQKCRLVADMVRGKPVEQAVTLLSHTVKKSAGFVKQVLESALANAEHNHGLDIDELKVSSIYVDEGRTLKRLKPRAKGRGDRILKRTCHITVVLSDDTTTV